MVACSNPGGSTFHLGPAPHSDWKYNNASAQRRLMDPGSCPHAQENISNVRERHIHHKRNLSRLVRICCYLSSCYYLQIVSHKRTTGTELLESFMPPIEV